MTEEELFNLKHDIFISYAHKDADVRESLLNFLGGCGLAPSQVWVDHKHLKQGAEWESAIREGIHQSRAFFLLLSLASDQSEYVYKEVMLAKERWQGHEERIIIIQADEQFENVWLLHLGLDKYQALTRGCEWDWRGTEDKRTNFFQLMIQRNIFKTAILARRLVALLNPQRATFTSCPQYFRILEEMSAQEGFDAQSVTDFLVKGGYAKLSGTAFAGDVQWHLERLAWFEALK